MRWKTWQIIMSMMMLMLISVCFCACGQTQTKTKTKTDPEPEQTETINEDGWKQVKDVDDKIMYSNILTSLGQTAYNFSSEKINKDNVFTFQTLVSFSVNGIEFDLSLKWKYDATDKRQAINKSIFHFEIIKKSDNFKILSMHIYRNELYVDYAGQKIKFDLSGTNWSTLFPLNIKVLSSNSISRLSGVLAQNVKLNSVKKLSKKKDNKEMFQYNISVNVKDSLVGIFTALSDKNVYQDQEKINEIAGYIAEIFEISTEKFFKGAIPETSMDLSMTVFDKEIEDFSADLSIALSLRKQEFFKDEELKLNFSMDEFKTSSNYGDVKIDFVNNTKEMQSYQKFDGQVFSFNLPSLVVNLTEKDAEKQQYVSNGLVKVDSDDPNNNYFMFTFSDFNTKKTESALYFYGGNMYIFTVNDDSAEYNCVYKQEANLNELWSKIVNSSFENAKKFNFLTMFAYVFNNLFLSENEMIVNISNAFFYKVLFNFENVIDFLNEESEYHLKELEEMEKFNTFIQENDIELVISYDSTENKVVEVLENDDERVVEIINTLNAGIRNFEDNE